MRLIDIRRKRKLTQERLETLSGVTQSVISRLENEEGASTTTDIDKKLSKALKVRPGTLEYGPSHAEAMSA